MSEREPTINEAQEHRRNPRALAVGALAAVVVATGFAVTRNGAEEKSASAASAGNTNVACGTVTGFEDFSTNASQYGTENFLPVASPQGIDNAKEAQDYIKALCGGEDGPFGSKVDASSEAAIMSALTEQATDKKDSTPINYDYVNVFNRAKAGYDAEGGVKKANTDLKTTTGILKQSVSYTPNFAGEGQLVTKMVAIRNLETNVVTGMELQPRKVKEDDEGRALGGVLVKMPAGESKGIDGFNEFLITSDGEIYLRGVVTTNGAQGKKTSGASKPTPKKKGEKQDNSQKAAPIKTTEDDNSGIVGKPQTKKGGASGPTAKAPSTSNKDKNAKGNGGKSNDGKGKGPQAPTGGSGPGKGPGTGGGGESGPGCGASCGSGSGGGGGGGGESGGCGSCGAGSSPTTPDSGPTTPTTTPTTPGTTPTTPNRPPPPPPQTTPPPPPPQTTPPPPPPTTTTPPPTVKPPMTSCDPNIDVC
ncbi:MAG: hypothetical protein ACR2FM_05590 [Candidatus Saccharimonadales bacterium]